MKFSQILAFAGLGSLALFTSCVDNDYDLDNMDKTIQLGANDLTVPINIDNITLNKILDVNDSSKVRKMKDPETGDSIYAVKEEGSFNSNEININSFTASRPTINPVEKDIDYGNVYEKLKDVKASDQEMVWSQITNEKLADYSIKKGDISPISINTGNVNVPRSVRKLEKVSVDCTITINMSFNISDYLDNVCFKDMTLQLPKGLDMVPSTGKYDSETGKLDLSNDGKGITMSNGSFQLQLHITGIDMTNAESGAVFNANDNADGTFAYVTNVEVETGSFSIYKSNFKSGKTFFNLPSSAKFECKPEMTDVAVNSITGNIKYDVDGISVNPISLTDLPDIISDGETNIILKNPQIYLTITNPLASKRLEASAGLSLTPMKGSEIRQSMTLDDGALKIVNANNIYCLSPFPLEPSAYYKDADNDFTKAEHKKFSSLSNIVSGSGVPDQIAVNVTDPGLLYQHVEDFELKGNLGKVEGRYLFFAPLNLDGYSRIVYNDTITGWNDDGTFDKVNISSLKLTANVASQIPLGATFDLKVIDKNGNVIPGVTFTTPSVEASKSNQSIVFTQNSGTITNLDGIILRAVMASDGSATLKPAQNVKLDNIRVTVTGNYQDEL